MQNRRLPSYRLRARRIARWLQFNKVLPLEERALMSYRQIAKRLPSRRLAEFAVVSRQHLALPADLAGILGTNPRSLA